MTTIDNRVTSCYSAALASFELRGPTSLVRRLSFELQELRLEGGVPDLVAYLQHTTPNDPIRMRFSLQFAKWDSEEPPPPWTPTSKPRTTERRRSVYDLLDIAGDIREVFDTLFPIKRDPRHVVIADDFHPWYVGDRRHERAFYWPAYQQHLLDSRKWPTESVVALNDSTADVVGRLSDPTRDAAYKSRGLVVGYVQSGKTANFTGVLAKVIDAGYRLLIVMTGTIDLLREQTQRRIDMELVGRENILRGIDADDSELMHDVDYQDDKDWIDGTFISHGTLPSDSGHPDIIRLTTHRFDYQSLRAGINALDFEKRVPTLPLYHKDNLIPCAARLVIVKKNKRVLTKLVRDLKRIMPRLHEVPALIIDDESDHASVNTSDPRRWEEGQPERTAINRLISELLLLLPRSQYIGYTATPYANVFVDPSDAADIFPKDFLISLQRPPGYMGVFDFHDIDSDIEPADRTYANSREKAHVRDLRATGQARIDELREALRMFVLTGAVKLFRQATDEFRYTHHTMLAHESVRKDDHRLLAREICTAWQTAGFRSPTGLDQLRRLYQRDLLPVTKAMGVGRLPVEFEDLAPYIAETVSRITENGDPVILVNSDEDAQKTVDFDKQPIWRVLVGGAKLSRGFTVEGLTISYYRRKTKQADTLAQMGRWFGFRQGYRDLVRLYIGREEPDGKRAIDLYEAFEAVMRDEERFREQLQQYAELVDGEPQITPAQIPPLVSQHLWWLRPAARNKMFNARLVKRRSPGRAIEPVAYPEKGSDIEHNYDALLPVMTHAGESDDFRVSGTTKATYRVLHGLVAHEELYAALKRLKWHQRKPDYFAADLAYLDELFQTVDNWVVIMPQTSKKVILPELGRRSYFLRQRLRENTFQSLSDPKHRHAARLIAGAETYSDVAGERLRAERRGAVVVYPIAELETIREQALDKAVKTDGTFSKRHCIVAFTLVSPTDGTSMKRALVEFQPQNSALKDLAIVPLES